MKLCPDICLDAGNGTLDDFRDDFFDIPIAISSPERKCPESAYKAKVWKKDDGKNGQPALF